jgi:hypothetical protein
MDIFQGRQTAGKLIFLFTQTWNTNDACGEHSVWLIVINSSTLNRRLAFFLFRQVRLCGHYVIAVDRPIDLWTQSGFVLHRPSDQFVWQRGNSSSQSSDLATKTFKQNLLWFDSFPPNFWHISIILFIVQWHLGLNKIYRWKSVSLFVAST